MKLACRAIAVTAIGLLTCQIAHAGIREARVARAATPQNHAQPMSTGRPLLSAHLRVRSPGPAAARSAHAASLAPRAALPASGHVEAGHGTSAFAYAARRPALAGVPATGRPMRTPRDAMLGGPATFRARTLRH